MLKKIGLILSATTLMLFAGGAVAQIENATATQHGVGSASYWDSASGSQVYSYLQVANGGSTTGSTTFTAMYDTTLTFQALKTVNGGNVAFGISTSTDGTTWTDGANLGLASGGAAASVDVSQGDMVRFWMEDTATGNKVYSDSSAFYANNSSDRGAMTESAMQGAGFAGTSENPYPWELRYDDTYNGVSTTTSSSWINGWNPGADVIIVVTATGSGGTSGQPLPGVLATLAVAGVVGAYRKRKADNS